ncbi:MAG TPA: AEC family transporter [Polyangiaceae bacterium]|nr:AEC family transporter [Polyangiaceae bacterium]
MTPEILLIFVCLAAGVGLRWTGRFPDHAARTLNTFVIWVSVPAVILLRIPPLFQTTRLGWELLVPVSMAWLEFGSSCLLFAALGRWFDWSRGTIGALILTAGLANTAFVGLPLLESLLGPSSIAIGLLADQPGSFLCLSTWGIFVAASHGAGSDPDSRTVLRGVLTFPPFIALGLALVLSYFGVVASGSFANVLDRLGATLVPVALVAVGLQLRVSRRLLGERAPALAAGLTFKLLLAPALLYGFYVWVLGQHGFATRVTILEAAMAPMIMSAVLADQFDLDRDTANLMVGVGIPLSLFTVPLWNLCLGALAAAP